jgi:hypothetical protein
MDEVVELGFYRKPTAAVPVLTAAVTGASSR